MKLFKAKPFIIYFSIGIYLLLNTTNLFYAYPCSAKGSINGKTLPVTGCCCHKISNSDINNNKTALNDSSCPCNPGQCAKEKKSDNNNENLTSVMTDNHKIHFESAQSDYPTEIIVFNKSINYNIKFDPLLNYKTYHDCLKTIKILI